MIRKLLFTSVLLVATIVGETSFIVSQVPKPAEADCPFVAVSPSPGPTPAFACAVTIYGTVTTTGGGGGSSPPPYNTNFGQTAVLNSGYTANCVNQPGGTVSATTVGPLTCDTAGRLYTNDTITAISSGLAFTSQAQYQTYPLSLTVGSYSNLLLNSSGALMTYITNSSTPTFVNPSATATPAVINAQNNLQVQLPGATASPGGLNEIVLANASAAPYTASNPVPVVIENTPAPYQYIAPYPGSSPVGVSGEYFGPSPQPTLSPGATQQIGLNVYGDVIGALDSNSGSGLLTSSSLPGYVRIVGGNSNAYSPQVNYLNTATGESILGLVTQSFPWFYTPKSTNATQAIADYSSNCGSPYCAVQLVNIGGSQTTKLTSASAVACTNIEAQQGRLNGIVSSATQTGTLYLYDEATATCATADYLYSVANLTAGQVITLNEFFSSGLSYSFSGTAFANTVNILRT